MSATYNGVAMTKAREDLFSDPFEQYSAIFYMLDASLPSAGSYNVQVTTSGAQHVGGGSVDLTGVNQGAPEATAGSNAGNGSSFSDNITTLSDNALVLDAGGGDGSATVSSFGSSQTSFRNQNQAGALLNCASYKSVASAGSTTMSETLTGSVNRRAHTVVSLTEAAPATPISFVGSDTSTSATANLTLDVPAGTQEGDLLIAVTINENDSPTTTWTAPAGWHLLVDRQGTGGTPTTPPSTWVWYRIAGASEPASYTWVNSASDRGLMGASLSYRGVDVVTPFDTTPTTATGSTGVPDPASITTLTPNAQVVAVGFNDNDNVTYTGYSSGYTTRVDSFQNDSGTGNGATLGIIDRSVASAGAEDPSAWTSAETEEWGAITLALRPNGVNIETGNLAQGNAGGTTSHTLTNKANRGVIVLIDLEGTTQASAVTYNGVNMTLVASSTTVVGAGNASSMWVIFEGLLPSSAGSYNVSVTGLSSAASVSVVELNNVEPVVPSGSQVDTNETGDVATSSTTVTAPGGNSISVGALGYGNDTANFNNPPSGTGTWTRLFQIINPPTSAHYGGAYQKWTVGGSKTYTETADANWFRASHIQAVFAEFQAGAGNTFFNRNP